MAKYTNVLHMTFKDRWNVKKTIRLADPRADLTEKEVLEVMNKVAGTQFFLNTKWDTVTPYSAKIVKTETDQILEIS